MLVVLGEYLWQREVIAAADQWNWALETCRVLGDYAGKKNLDIALELEPFRMSLLNNVNKMAALWTNARIRRCGPIST